MNTKISLNEWVNKLKPNQWMNDRSEQLKEQVN